MRQAHEWIVFVYAAWDELYRPRLAAARGIAPMEILVPLFGDLRRLRHDVVHHKGIASVEWTGRCEVLGHWFNAGDVIDLDGKKIDEFIRAIPLGGPRGRLTAHSRRQPQDSTGGDGAKESLMRVAA